MAAFSRADLGERLLQIHGDNGRRQGDDGKKKEPPQSEKLLKKAECLTLFRDQHNEPFIFLDGQAVPLKSERVRQYLAYEYYRSEGRAPNCDSLNQALSVLKGKALFERPQIALHNRIAWKDEAIWYDLGGRGAVRVSQAGWRIVDEAPILFRRYAHQQEQVTPTRDSDVAELFQFLNVDESHHTLVAAYVVTCFVPDIPHPIFHPYGPQGAGKTTLSRIIKRLCDPSSIETVITPRDLAQLVQVMSHHHVCLFDNMSDLPGWMSDILAQACTGGGFSKRQLYTDDDDIIYQVKRCIGLNGINSLITKPDLMDRAILLHLERLDSSKRREETEFWSDFDKARPRILGGIFDALSTAMGIYQRLSFTHLPRMADFFKWGYAVAEALGGKGSQFRRAYECNIERQNEEVIQSNTLAQAVIRLMNDRDAWSGLIGDAYQALVDIASPDRNDTTFPKSQRLLRKHLERIKTNLNEVGISFTVGKRADDGYPLSFQKGENFATFATSDEEPQNIKDIDDVANPGDCISYSFRSSEKALQINDDVANVANVANSGAFRKELSLGCDDDDASCMLSHSRCERCERLRSCILTPGQREMCGGPFSGHRLEGSR